MPSGILEIYLLWFAINKNFIGLMIFNPRMDKAAKSILISHNAFLSKI